MVFELSFEEKVVLVSVVGVGKGSPLFRLFC